MKLRIESENICFRLDFEALEQLLSAGELHQSIALPDGFLTYGVRCLPIGEPAEFQAQHNDFLLSIARNDLETHKSSLPSLSGLMYDFATKDGKKITVSFEINLQKKRKKSPLTGETNLSNI